MKLQVLASTSLLKILMKTAVKYDSVDSFSTLDVF